MASFRTFWNCDESIQRAIHDEELGDQDVVVESKFKIFVAHTVTPVYIEALAARVGPNLARRSYRGWFSPTHLTLSQPNPLLRRPLLMLLGSLSTPAKRRLPLTIPYRPMALRVELPAMSERLALVRLMTR